MGDEYNIDNLFGTPCVLEFDINKYAEQYEAYCEKMPTISNRHVKLFGKTIWKNKPGWEDMPFLIMKKYSDGNIYRMLDWIHTYGQSKIVKKNHWHRMSFSMSAIVPNGDMPPSTVGGTWTLFRCDLINWKELVDITGIYGIRMVLRPERCIQTG